MVLYRGGVGVSIRAFSSTKEGTLLHLNTSSKGRVSEKQESQTSLTILVAWTSSLHPGLFMTDRIARVRTQFWNCCVTFQLPLVKASRVHRHSPLNMDARIWRKTKISQHARIYKMPAVAEDRQGIDVEYTSVQAACRKLLTPSIFHLKKSHA